MRRAPTPPIDRMVSEQAFKKALLLALLVHLFASVSVPTYTVRLPRNASGSVESPFFDWVTRRDQTRLDRWKQERRPYWLELLPDPSETRKPRATATRERRDTCSTEAGTKPPSFLPWTRSWDRPPELLHLDLPEYPMTARKAGVEDTLIVQLFVTAEGRVADHRFVDGSEVFRDAVRATIPTMRFRPAMYRNEPTGIWISQVFTFRLEDR